MPTVVNDTHIECEYSESVALVLDSIEVSNRAQITLVGAPAFETHERLLASSELAFSVAKTTDQDERSYVCKLMINHAVLHSDACHFAMPDFHTDGAYDASLWIEALEEPLVKFAEVELVIVHVET